MSLSDAIRQRILELMKKHEIKTVHQLAILSGLSNALSDFMKGRIDLLHLDSLLHVCEGFNIQLYDFFNSPIFKDVKYEKH